MFQNETINTRLYNLSENQKILKNRILTLEEKNRQLNEKNELLIKKMELMKIGHKQEIENLIDEKNQNINESRLLELEKEISQLKENPVLNTNLINSNEPTTSIVN